MAHILCQHVETIRLSNFGNSIRDFTYVSDVVDGIMASLAFKTDKPEIFNLGGNNPVKLLRFVQLIEEGLGNGPSTKELVPMQAGDVPMTYASISKAQSLLGWSPKVPIEDGTSMFLDWFNSNDASRYLLPPKKQVCVINSSFTMKRLGRDRIMNVSAYGSDRRLAFYFFSNLDLDQ